MDVDDSDCSNSQSESEISDNSDTSNDETYDYFESDDDKNDTNTYINYNDNDSENDLHDLNSSINSININNVNDDDDDINDDNFNVPTSELTNIKKYTIPQIKQLMKTKHISTKPNKKWYMNQLYPHINVDNIQTINVIEHMALLYAYHRFPISAPNRWINISKLVYHTCEKCNTNSLHKTMLTPFNSNSDSDYKLISNEYKIIIKYHCEQQQYNYTDNIVINNIQEKIIHPIDIACCSYNI
jgi:hypothetical protein